MRINWFDLSGETRTSGEQVAYRHCPACADNNWHFYVNPTTGGWICFKCSQSGYLPGHTPPILPTKQASIEWNEIEIPEPKPLGTEALAYLAKRGIDPEWASRFGLCESDSYPYRKRIIIPYMWRGELIYFTGRDYTELSEDRYFGCPGRHPLYYLGYNMNPSLEQIPIVVVEGPFDGMNIAMAGYRSIALSGKTLPKHLESMMVDICKDTAAIHILLDRGELGDSLKLERRLNGLNIYPTIIVLNEYKDPGKMPLDKIKELVG